MAISKQELYISIALFVVVLLYTIFFYRETLYISFSEKEAKVSGIKTDIFNFSFTILTAVVVALASKIVGALIVSSLMIVPVAASLIISRSYKENLIVSILISLFSIVSGLIISFYADLKPGGTIVLISIGILFVALIAKQLRLYIKKIRHLKEHKEEKHRGENGTE